ncbi:cation efflux protein [Dipodascopsis uninucleata]
MGLGRQGRIISLLVIDSLFFFLEVIIGYTVHSLALVADSFHMLNDVFSLVVALWAVKAANSKEASSEYSYGWQRAEILGALINGVFLLALCLTIFLEALQRFVEPQVITNPALILVVGCAGLVSNIVGLALFHEHGHSHGHSHGNHSHGDGITDGLDGDVDAMEIGALLPESVVQESLERQRRMMQHSREIESPSPVETVAAHEAGEETALLDGDDHASHNSQSKRFRRRNKKLSTQSLNMRGVFLHVMGDALGNVGVIATALFIWLTDYSWRFYFDPVVSLVITCIIFSSALPLVKSASKILLQGAPKGIDIRDVQHDILSLEGVKSVHDLHIWILRENLFIASLHVSVYVNADEFMSLSRQIRQLLHEYGIHSATIQPEFISSSHSGSPRSRSFDNTIVDGDAGEVTITPGIEDLDQSCLCVDGCAEAACCIKKDNATDENEHENGHTHSH